MTNYEKGLIRSVIRKSQEFENVLTKGESIYDSLNNSPAKEDIDLLTKEILNIGSLVNKESSDISRLTTDKKKSNNLVEAWQILLEDS